MYNVIKDHQVVQLHPLTNPIVPLAPTNPIQWYLGIS